MSTVIIGGGPRPQARIVQVSEMQDQTGSGTFFEIRDGREVLAELKSIEHASALLKILQEGE